MKETLQQQIEQGCKKVEEVLQKIVNVDREEILPPTQDALLPELQTEEIMQPIESNLPQEIQPVLSENVSMETPKDTEIPDAVNAEIFAAETAVSVDVKEKQCPEPENVSDSEKKWVKVLKDIIALQAEISSIKKSVSSEEGELCEHITARLEEILERSGADIIEEDKIFCLRRHQPVPMALVKDGAAIEKTVMPGWAVGEQVLRRALVAIEK